MRRRRATIAWSGSGPRAPGPRRTGKCRSLSWRTQGTLDFLILRTIELEPKHGWAIVKRIEQISVMHFRSRRDRSIRRCRLERQGWITARPGRIESGREVKFYPLTRAGRAHLKKELANRDRLSNAINLVIRMA